MKLSNFLCLLPFITTVQCHVPRLRHSRLHSPSSQLGVSKRADDDPSDFSWVKRWAAIGDSYTAGIGAGRPLGKLSDGENLDVDVQPGKIFLNISLPNLQISGHDNWYCARYDMSYPMIISRHLGPQVEDFQYAACSGDRAGQIYQQAKQIEGDLDLVMMTAGGNDLCLVSTHPEPIQQNDMTDRIKCSLASSRIVSFYPSTRKRHVRLCSKWLRRM